MSRIFTMAFAVPVFALMAILAGPGMALADGLTLNVDQFSGVISIENLTGSPLALDSYQITSASGGLAPSTWTSLQSQGVTGWNSVAPSTHALSELNLTSSSSIAVSGAMTLGTAFTLTKPHDLQWGYTSPNMTATLPATVQYTGGLEVRVINLYGAGQVSEGIKVALVNPEPMSFGLDAYSLVSATSSLNSVGFTGFSGSGVAGWQSVAPSDGALSELNLTGSTTLAANGMQPLGSAFYSNGFQDVNFQYHVTGAAGGSTYTGTVKYVNQLSGDVNNDGVVNGLDIALVASNWLHTKSVTGDANYDGVVNGLDIAAVAAHWLLTAGSGAGGGAGGSAAAVPEPSSLALLGLGVTLGSFYLRGSRQRRFFS